MDYAVRAIKHFRCLQKTCDEAARVIDRQDLCSATSIGAPVGEGLSGESPRDVIHKYGIAQKGARQSLDWLTLLLKADIVTESRLRAVLDATNQLVAILAAFIVKARREPAVG